MELEPTVFVLDDDESFARGVDRLLCAEGFSTRTWTSVTAFLEQHDPRAPGCLLCDLVMPEMSGLELQRRLFASGCIRPVVFITGREDMNAAVEGMRAGAVSFLRKPVMRAALIGAIGEALVRDSISRAEHAKRLRVAALLATLTPREHDVLDLVARGMLNKQIADKLGIAEKTIKVHRGRVMHKMQVRSAAALAHVLTDHPGSVMWYPIECSPASLQPIA